MSNQPIRTSTNDIIGNLSERITVSEDGVPDFWPELEPGDIGCRSSRHKDNSPCCSVGWIEWLLKSNYNKFRSSVGNTLRSNLREYFKDCPAGGDMLSIVELSDRSTPEQRVRAWNKTGKDLNIPLLSR